MHDGSFKIVSGGTDMERASNENGNHQFEVHIDRIPAFLNVSTDIVESPKLQHKYLGWRREGMDCPLCPRPKIHQRLHLVSNR